MAAITDTGTLGDRASLGEKVSAQAGMSLKRKRAKVRIQQKDREASYSGSGAGQAQEPLDERPHSVYEVVTRQMLEQVKNDVAEVKGRVNALLWLVAGTALLDLIMRVVLK
jgi:hypothetical protein